MLLDTRCDDCGHRLMTTTTMPSGTVCPNCRALEGRYGPARIDYAAESRWQAIELERMERGREARISRARRKAGR